MISIGIDYRRIYSLFNSLTPLPADCGALCGSACCAGHAAEGREGMRLFPGEPAPAGLAETEGLAVCAGRCDRTSRPLACRIFPLFPYLAPDGRIRAIYDPRAWRICPLVRGRNHVRLRPAFVRAVRAAGRMAAAAPEGRAYLAAVSRELEDYNRLLRLDDGRGPICRRKKKHEAS